MALPSFVQHLAVLEQRRLVKPEKRGREWGWVARDPPGPDGRQWDSLLRPVRRHYILNRMVHYQQAHLDASFAALSDATRRGILERLGTADASITELAGKFQMTLTGMKKHVAVLERTGLVTTRKIGRVRTCQLGPRRLEAESAWLAGYRELWDARFDELDKLLDELKRKEQGDERRNRK